MKILFISITLTGACAFMPSANAQVCPGAKIPRFKELKKKLLQAKPHGAGNFIFSPSMRWRLEELCDSSSGCTHKFTDTNKKESFSVKTSGPSGSYYTAFDEKSGTFSGIANGSKIIYVDLKTKSIVERPFPANANSNPTGDLIANGKYAVFGSKPDPATGAIHLIRVDVATGTEVGFPAIESRQADAANGIFYGVDPKTGSLDSFSLTTGGKRFNEDFGGGKVRHVSKPDASGDVFAIVELSGRTHVMKYNLKSAQYSSVRDYPRTFAAPILTNISDVITAYDPQHKDRVEILGNNGKSALVQNPDPNESLYAFTFSSDGSLQAFHAPSGVVAIGNVENGTAPTPMVFTRETEVTTNGVTSTQIMPESPYSAQFIDANNLLLGFGDRLELVDPYTQNREVLLRRGAGGFNPLYPLERAPGADPLESHWVTRDNKGRASLITAIFECVRKRGGSFGGSYSGSGGSGTSGSATTKKN